MDWTQALTIMLVTFGTVMTMGIWLSSKIDTKTDAIRKELGSEIATVRKDLGAEIQKNREELIWIRYRLDPDAHKRAVPEEYKPPEQ